VGLRPGRRRSRACLVILGKISDGVVRIGSPRTPHSHPCRRPVPVGHARDQGLSFPYFGAVRYRNHNVLLTRCSLGGRKHGPEDTNRELVTDVRVDEQGTWVWHMLLPAFGAVRAPCRLCPGDSWSLGCSVMGITSWSPAALPCSRLLCTPTWTVTVC
jgi:hypothetical protein